MIDLQLLKQKFATSDERLKTIFTAERPTNLKELKEGEQEEIEKTVKTRERIEKLLESRLFESVQFNLKNATLYSAVDLAWDSDVINRTVYPLRLVAQGKLQLGDCATSLEKAGFGKYITRNEKGTPISVDLPKFYETSINLIRSIMTRRLAAQANKYSNLWPFYKYEARGTSLEEKLYADLVSQRMDIMADQYDHKHHEVQVDREMLMYANVVDFVRSAWEKEEQVRRKVQKPGLETEELETEVVVVKEGVTFVNPHPSRVFWDTNYPLPSLNSDTGCEWVGYWDVCRYRDVHLNSGYWNRDKVSYSSNTAGIFTTYSQYFSQYYCVISAPMIGPDLSSANDRKNNVGFYGSDQGDTSMIKSEFFWKVKPKEWGLGDYPHDCWIRFVLGGDSTILYAEYLPDSPCAVASHNSNDSRLVNISFAHELMGYQDQLTQLFTHLLLCLQADHIKVMVIDAELANPEQILAFREQIKGSAAHPGTIVLEVSRKKLEELGVSDPSKIVQLVETRSMQIEVIFRAIGQLIQMVERMAALSPQEQGQPAPREISATETNLIAGTTESVYGFISDSIDEYRAAKKRICFASWIVMGEEKFKLPVMARYPKKVIAAAGFEAEGGDSDAGSYNGADGDRIARFTVTGTKWRLSNHDYIFTSRDGAERPANTQAANVLVQLLNTLVTIPQVAQALKKEQLYEIVSEVFRLSGAGYDLKLELQPGEENEMGPDPNQVIKDIQGVLDGLIKAGEQSKAEIEQIKTVLEPLVKMFPQAQPVLEQAA